MFEKSHVVDNKKIKLPPLTWFALRHIPDAGEVRWHIDPAMQVVIARNQITEDGYKWVGTTKITDGGRYIRAPEDVPEPVRDQLRQQHRDILDFFFMQASPGTTLDAVDAEIRDAVTSIPKHATDDIDIDEFTRNAVFFYAPDLPTLLEDRRVWLYPEKTFRAAVERGLDEIGFTPPLDPEAAMEEFAADPPDDAST